MSSEGKEGGGKAADIYRGVVDLFSIILPGALFALVLWAVLKASNTDFFKGTEFPEFVPASHLQRLLYNRTSAVQSRCTSNQFLA